MKPRTPPRLADLLIALCLAEGPAADAARGDLHEEYAERRAVAASWSASLWYWHEAMSLAWAFGRERLRETPRRRQAGEARGDTSMRILWEDVRFAARNLTRRPLFAALVVATLALGIGGNVALFSVVDGVLLRPLPYPEPDRLVMVWENDRLRGTDRDKVSGPDYLDMLEMNRSFAALAARFQVERTLGTREEPLRVSSARVSAGYFRVLGVRPLLGRTFLPEEERPGQDRVVVLSEGFWREHFAADPRALGASVMLDGEPSLVVGVVPSESRLPGMTDEVFEPLAVGPKDRDVHNLRVLARLKPEVTVAAAQTDLTSVMKRLEERYPYPNLGHGAWVRPLVDDVVGDSRPALLLLFGAVSLLLLMACASVANLVLTRGVAREREFAIRTSLGAGPLRLFRQLITESLLLAGLGGALGALLAVWLVRLVRVLGPELPRLREVAVDDRALAFALLVSVVSALVFGTIPALKSARRRPQVGLREGGRTFGSARGHRTRRSLVAFELAAAVVLVVGAGLLLRSFWKLRQVDPGYDSHGVLMASVSLAGPGYVFPKTWPVLDWPAFNAFEDAVTARLSANPRLQSVALAYEGPTDPGWATGITVVGRPAPPPGAEDQASFRPVSAGYFRTLGIPFTRGREFTRFDAPGRPLTLIVNEAFVARHFPATDPLGQSIDVFGRPRVIVGVVRNERFSGLEAGPAPAMYLPLSQNPQPALTLVLRTTGDPLELLPAVRDALRAVDPTLALFDVGTVDAALAHAREGRRFILLLLASFAFVAFALAAVGIYGVVSYAVSERTREVGVRIALGAEPRHVFRMVVGQGMSLCVGAVAAGTVAALALGRVMERLLFGVEARDPATFLTVAAVLIGASFVASAVPALRATRVDPVTALRAE